MDCDDILQYGSLEKFKISPHKTALVCNYELQKRFPDYDTVISLRKKYLRNNHGARRTLNLPKVERSEYSTAQNDSTTPSRASSVSDFVPHTRKIGYGLAAAAMLPAIFVQVPSGLSVTGSLVSGLNSADQITRNTTNATTLSSADVTAGTTLNSIALNVGFSVVQIAIGITVGLFLAALIVYPLGKRRSGLFSF